MTAVSDNFGGTLAAWTSLVGTHTIVGGKLRCTNTGAAATGNYNRHDTSTGSIDCFAQGVISSTQADGSSATGMACRMRSGANTSYQVIGRHAGDTFNVWRIVAASETQLNWQTGSATLTSAWASGDTVREEVVGSLIRAKLNGALVGLCVDSTITDGQLVGVNSFNASVGDLAEWDDFAGGALIADGGLVAPFIAGIGAQVTGTGTTLTPTVPTPSTGDLVLVLLTSRDAAQTMTAPGSEGWSSVESPTQAGLEDVLFAKTWGTGSTDDATPTFSIGSGAAGWGATAVIIRNPLHASFPWTTVASAVVASGSAANATSATVTAPSVTDTGTHRTLARFFSSADDNALLTQNEGALVLGGANYDSTTGNDFAQAMSIREDVATAGSTGTATVTETLVGNDVNNGITLVISIPTSATVNATTAADLGGTATATITVDHPATTASDLGGTASATATRTTFATVASDLGGVASAAAAPVLSATVSAALGGVATASAVPDHPVVAASDLGATATTSATVTHPATVTSDLGGTAAVTAVRDTAAVVAAALGGVATANATPDHPATATAALGGDAQATAVVTHPATVTADLGFTAAATASVPGGPVLAATDAQLGGTATASATVDHPATTSASFGGVAAATATPVHPAVAAASLGGAASATADVVHPASVTADLGGTAQATAAVTHLAVVAADLGFTAEALAGTPQVVHGTIDSDPGPWPAGAFGDTPAHTAVGVVG